MLVYIYVFILLLPLIFFKKYDVFAPSFFLNIYFIVFVASGPAVLYFLDRQIYDSARYDEVVLMIALAYIGLNVGFWFASSKHSFPAWSTRISMRRLAKVKELAFVLLVVGVGSGVLYYLNAGFVPMLQENKEFARVAALRAGGNGYLQYLMSLSMVAILLGSIYLCASFEKVFFSQRLIAISILFLVLLVMTGTGSRRFAFWTVLYFIICHHYFIRRIRVLTLVLIGGAAFLLVNIFEIFRNPDSMTTVDLSTTVFYRLIIYASNLEKVFDVFFRSDLMYGSTFFMDLLTALPGKQTDYQTWLKDEVGLTFEGFGLPPTIVGDMYVNFGVFGVFLGSAVFGFLSHFIYKRLIILSLSPQSVFVYVLILEVFVKTLTSGISAQFVSLVWVGLIAGPIYYVLRREKYV